MKNLRALAETQTKGSSLKDENEKWPKDCEIKKPVAKTHWNKFNKNK